VTFNRLVQTPIQLSDGTHLPTGTLFCMAAGAIARDPNVVPDPTKFDGLRWYTKRQDPKEANKHQHAMTDSNTMHFGHGRYACPGRFFASNEIKLILAHLVMNYDFNFLDGKGRPETLTLDENMFPDPKAKILIKRRPVERALKPLLEIRGS
jgi:ent-kaurene oxidase